MIYVKSNRRTLILGAAAFVLSASPLAAKKKRHHAKPQHKTKTPQTERLMAWVASMQVHGARDADVDPHDLLARIDGGQRIECRCGTVAAVGILAAQRAGYEARLVGCFTTEPWVGNDGHEMLEVREGNAWTLYDLDGNRKAPQGVGIADQCAGPLRWQPIAHDQGCVTECDILSDLATFDARVFDVPWILDGGVICFHDAREIIEPKSPAYHWVDAEAWAALVG